jgi:hypothetical protein
MQVADLIRLLQCIKKMWIVGNAESRNKECGFPAITSFLRRQEPKFVAQWYA